jgi:hypothetical protein
VGLTSLSSSVRKHPLLVLRAVDDEASLVLAAATIGTRFSRLLEKSSYKIYFLLALFFISLAVITLVWLAFKFIVPLDDFMASAFMTRFFQLLQPISDFMASAFSDFMASAFMTRFLQLLQPISNFSWFDWIPAFLNGLVLAFFAFLFSPGAFNSAYGRELLPIFQGCEINSQSAPDSIDRQSEFQSESTPTNWAMVVTLHQAEEARRGLRHGLYDDPQCAERIAGWLQSELASRGT